MLEILFVVLFCWLFFLAIKFFFKIAWCVAKIVAVILLVLALPTLIGCLLLAGGFLLLIPIAMIAIAVGLLKSCL